MQPPVFGEVNFKLKWLLRTEKQNVNFDIKRKIYKRKKQEKPTEKVPDAAGSHSNKHLIKLGPGGVVEWHICLSCHCSGQ